jgi:hypothetical protein
VAQKEIADINAQMEALKERLKTFKSSNGIKHATPKKKGASKSQANLLLATAEESQLEYNEPQSSHDSHLQSESDHGECDPTSYDNVFGGKSSFLDNLPNNTPLFAESVKLQVTIPTHPC